MISGRRMTRHRRVGCPIVACGLLTRGIEIPAISSSVTGKLETPIDERKKKKSWQGFPVPSELKAASAGASPGQATLRGSRDATDVTARGPLCPGHFAPSAPAKACSQGREIRTLFPATQVTFTPTVAPSPACPRSHPFAVTSSHQLPPLTPPAKHVADRPVNQSAT